jgi:hypothetical protein
MPTELLGLRLMNNKVYNEMFAAKYLYHIENEKFSGTGSGLV